MLLVNLLAAVILAMVVCQACEISVDCNDSEGRTLCYEKSCRKDVPCNKDNDCFFYGAADVSHNYPHPKCYKNPQARSPPGYGICMLKESAGGLQRLPGDDVVDNKGERDVETVLNLNNLLKRHIV